MDRLRRLLAEHACERLIVGFVHRPDLGEPASVAELFTADGSWEWPAGGRRVEGREALRQYFGSRPADRLSRRLMSNVLVTPTSPDTATATSYFTTYRVDGYDGGMVPAGPPTQIGLPHSRLRSSGGTPIDDTFRRAEGTWLLASRTLFLPFGGETPRLTS
ncbi:nuclear transport factor 2 family protein [Streptomyces gibsoniae]|uniref:Nuclear transport factor 2 family protein n=1 Tax=Streptomyces gibsoniae TaxID=3075529 RepID=A0ABU2TKK7_9ACTN|nr:nuclear transport factor 2 family protein [Streptomyces sp. DSM 41699]MDT0461444.1 nuclear transport factor 2 family protein [Streptomyces sp. DSM 41699]